MYLMLAGSSRFKLDLASDYVVIPQQTYYCRHDVDHERRGGGLQISIDG